MPFRIDNERAMIADGRDVLLLVDEDYFITLFEDIGRPENDEGVNAEADPDTELDLDDVFGTTDLYLHDAFFSFLANTAFYSSWSGHC